MRTERTIAFHGPGDSGTGERIRRFCESHGLGRLVLEDLAAARAMMNRTFPGCLVLDARDLTEEVLSLCSELKHDAFTAIVPLVVLTPAGEGRASAQALASGADEVMPTGISDREFELRMELVLRRAHRDVAVHPTTRLPGTIMIERDIQDRMRRGGRFGVCYADLDHFKEFNDRYGYRNGDRVILLLSRILRDVVRALAPGGFVGHIGGDDFIYNVPLDFIAPVGDEVIQLFDELIPYQYTEEDRRAGYFLGKDRRGAVRRTPIMTLSIGVVTNQFHEFAHTGQVSELAAEMKSYAKSLPGSKYVVDRRQPPSPEPGGGMAPSVPSRGDH